MLRIILCGQKSFGNAVFRMIQKRRDAELVGVFAPKDDPLETLAGMCQVPFSQSGTLRSDRIPDDVDLIVAAHSHDFISRAVRNRLRLGAIGYHPSLLPLHRGRDAVRWTIRMREPIAGGTVFWLSDTVDGGPIARQEWCYVRRDDDASSLWRRELFPMGIRLLSDTLDDISVGLLVMRDQDPALATWEPSFSGSPPLYRPELPQLGCLPDGFAVKK